MKPPPDHLTFTAVRPPSTVTYSVAVPTPEARNVIKNMRRHFKRNPAAHGLYGLACMGLALDEPDSRLPLAILTVIFLNPDAKHVREMLETIRKDMANGGCHITAVTSTTDTADPSGIHIQPVKRVTH